MKKKQIMGRRCIVYCRVATKTGSGDMAMEQQSAVLHERATKLGVEVVGEVQAYEKGIILNRSGWHRVLKLASKEQADMVFVGRLDRVARGLSELMDACTELRQKGISLHVCDPLDAHALRSMTEALETL